MQKGNMADHTNQPAEKTISDELEEAIQMLIYRLRELGPIQTA